EPLRHTRGLGKPMGIDRAVHDYAHAPVLRIHEVADLEAADALMRRHDVSDLLVVDKREAPVGVISRTDLLRVGRIHARGRARLALLTLPERPVGEVMTRGVVSVAPATCVSEVAAAMIRRRIHRVFVGAGGAITGVFATRELLHAIIDARIEAPLCSVMSTPV